VWRCWPQNFPLLFIEGNSQGDGSSSFATCMHSPDLCLLKSWCILKLYDHVRAYNVS
jgi:hypothetical protein